MIGARFAPVGPARIVAVNGVIDGDAAAVLALAPELVEGLAEAAAEVGVLISPETGPV